MPAIAGFVGGNDVQRSLNLADNRCVNLFPTTDDSGSISAFYGTAGLSLYSTAASVFSGLYTASNGRAFAVSGTTLYEIIGTSLTSRGSVTAGTVSRMSDNGIEMIIVNGTDGWIFTFATNTLVRLSSKQGTFTVTIAAPAVFTSTAHGLIAGDAIQLSTTTGTVASDNILTHLSPESVASGTNPSYIVTSPNGNFVYELNFYGLSTPLTISQYARDVTTGLISPISSRDYSLYNLMASIFVDLGAPLPPGYIPNSAAHDLKITADGKFLYVLLDFYGVASHIPAIAALSLDSTSGNISGISWYSGAIGVPLYNSIAITSDGLNAYILSTASNVIYQHSRNVTTGALTLLVPNTVAATSPTRIVIAPDDSSVYAISNTNFIYQFDKVAGLLSPLGSPTIGTGTGPDDIAISADGKSVYVVNFTANTISQYSRDLAGHQLTALPIPTIATGTGPGAIIVSPDGASVYVANFNSNTISMYSRDSTSFQLTNASTATVNTRNNPFSLAITADGSSVYATNFNSNTIEQFKRNASSTNIGLPTGLATLTTYYVISTGLTANNFEVSATLGGSAISTSGTQAGTHTFATLAAGFPNGCKTISYIDGRFVACQPNTQNFFVSDVLKGNTWQTINVQTADSNPDYVVGQVTLHNELIIFCEQTGEVYYDSGQYPSPFIRNVSGIFEVGCIAPYSIAKIDNSVMWLGKSNTGQGVIYRLNGYTPVRLSSYAIEYAMQTMSTITDAQAFTYQQEGHHFYVITFPTGGRTFVYDINTSLWHERQSVASSTISIPGGWTPNNIYSSGTFLANGNFNTGQTMSWNGSVFCVVGESASGDICYTSPDGIVWTQRTIPTAPLYASIAWNGSVFCAVGDSLTASDGNYVATSPDGITWTARTGAVSAAWRSIVYHSSSGLFVAIGWSYGASAAKIMTSPDGITWTNRSIPGSAPSVSSALSSNGTKLVCVFQGFSTTWLSNDGITWTTGASAIAGANCIAWNGSIFCALQGDSQTSSIAATSPDGITWTQRAMPESVSWEGISALSGVFCAINKTNNNTYFSADGVSWTLSAVSGTLGRFCSIANNGTIFCIAGGYVAPAISAISGAVSVSYTYGAWEVREYAYFNNKHLVTDSSEGRIYYLDPNSYTDGGVARTWIRSFRAPPSDMKRVNHHKLWLEYEGGVGNGSAPNPQISLRYSNDGGHTWSTPRTVSMGTAGQYTKRVFWYRLGMTTGQPRIYELSSSDPVKVTLIGAFLD